jgi:predicted DNA-binding transcriptional regulator AlpA
VKLLNRRQLGDKGLPNSKAHIWRACHNPDPEFPFPQPIRIGRNTFWVEEEIDQYLTALTAKRDGQKGRAA